MAQTFDILHRAASLPIPQEGKRSLDRRGRRPHLVGLVEEQAEVGEDHPQLLPAVAVLELPQQVSRELILQGRRKTMSATPKCTFKQTVCRLLAKLGERYCGYTACDC